MALSAQQFGTTAQTVGVELILCDISVVGVFTAHIELTLMQAGDVVELRWYQMILTGAVGHVAYLDRRAGVQPTDDAIALSVPIANELTDGGALRFTLTQSKGTTRAFPWKVLRYT